jgi:hypothetical protein
MIHETIGVLLIISGVAIALKPLFKRKKPAVKRKPYVQCDILVYLN